jgi:hypothetical protein
MEIPLISVPKNRVYPLQQQAVHRRQLNSHPKMLERSFVKLLLLALRGVIRLRMPIMQRKRLTKQPF